MGRACARFAVSMVLVTTALAAVAPAGVADEPTGGDAFAGDAVLPDPELVGMRAGDGDVTSTVASNQTVTVTSSGNSVQAGDASAGVVSIADNAFQQMRGVNNLVLVTGQNSTGIGTVSVNIHLQ